MKLLLFLIIILLDKITKIVFKNKYYDLKLFSINYIENKGIAFGLFPNNTLFIIITSLIILILIYYLIKTKKHKLALTLLLAGSISNLTDRIIFGYIIDFIDFKIWPVFNIADISNTIGVILLLFPDIISYLKVKTKLFKKDRNKIN